MPLLTPTDPQSPEFRREQVRSRVRTLLDDIYRNVKTGHDQLAQVFQPDARTQKAFAELPADEAYGALGEDAAKLRKLRSILRDFLNEASPGSGDLEPALHLAAFGENAPERNAAPAPQGPPPQPMTDKEVPHSARYVESPTGPVAPAAAPQSR